MAIAVFKQIIQNCVDHAALLVSFFLAFKFEFDTYGHYDNMLSCKTLFVGVINPFPWQQHLHTNHPQVRCGFS